MADEHVWRPRSEWKGWLPDSIVLVPGIRREVRDGVSMLYGSEEAWAAQAEHPSSESCHFSGGFYLHLFNGKDVGGENRPAEPEERVAA